MLRATACRLLLITVCLLLGLTALGMPKTRQTQPIGATRH